MENSKVSETPKRNIKELLINNFAFLGLVLVLVLFEILTGGKLLGQRNLMNIHLLWLLANWIFQLELL